jgi:hypothetical protein
LDSSGLVPGPTGIADKHISRYDMAENNGYSIRPLYAKIIITDDVSTLFYTTTAQS